MLSLCLFKFYRVLRTIMFLLLFISFFFVIIENDAIHYNKLHAAQVNIHSNRWHVIWCFWELEDFMPRSKTIIENLIVCIAPKLLSLDFVVKKRFLVNSLDWKPGRLVHIKAVNCQSCFIKGFYDDTKAQRIFDSNAVSLHLYKITKKKEFKETIDLNKLL